ncbi:MAG: Gfo/Idh/MocA family oxidoreductase [Tepidisphaeraceae bacterium]
MKEHRIGRRGFLRRTAAALGALAVPHLVPTSALGADGESPPSDRITMGFIGVGGQGGGHLAGGAWTYLKGGYLGRPDVQVLAVCDLNPARLKGAKATVEQRYADRIKSGSYKGCADYRDFRELLARDDIDAVLIATKPPNLHAIITIMAAKSGKDVYCEKPTAGTIRESRAMVAAIQRYGRVFQAGTQQRSEYEGRFHRAVELVRNGAIGELKIVYTMTGGAGGLVNVHPLRPLPDGSDQDLLGTATVRAPSGGYPNWEQHHFDCAQWGVDGDRTGPVEIYREPNGPMVLRYASGVQVHCGAPNYSVPRFQGSVVYEGTQGKIIVGREALIADPPGILDTTIGPRGNRVYYSNSHSGNFLQCIRSRQLPICDVETAHRSMSMILLAGMGHQLGRRLQWDPAREQFLGDDEANRMLCAVARPPWRI